jgi:hypothetical protein
MSGRWPLLKMRGGADHSQGLADGLIDFGQVLDVLPPVFMRSWRGWTLRPDRSKRQIHEATLKFM